MDAGSEFVCRRRPSVRACMLVGPAPGTDGRSTRVFTSAKINQSINQSSQQQCNFPLEQKPFGARGHFCSPWDGWMDGWILRAIRPDVHSQSETGCPVRVIPNRFFDGGFDAARIAGTARGFVCPLPRSIDRKDGLVRPHTPNGPRGSQPAACFPRYSMQTITAFVRLLNARKPVWRCAGVVGSSGPGDHAYDQGRSGGDTGGLPPRHTGRQAGTVRPMTTGLCIPTVRHLQTVHRATGQMTYMRTLLPT